MSAHDFLAARPGEPALLVHRDAPSVRGRDVALDERCDARGERRSVADDAGVRDLDDAVRVGVGDERVGPERALFAVVQPVVVGVGPHWVGTQHSLL